MVDLGPSQRPLRDVSIVHARMICVQVGKRSGSEECCRGRRGLGRMTPYICRRKSNECRGGRDARKSQRTRKDAGRCDAMSAMLGSLEAVGGVGWSMTGPHPFILGASLSGQRAASTLTTRLSRDAPSTFHIVLSPCPPVAQPIDLRLRRQHCKEM